MSDRESVQTLDRLAGLPSSQRLEHLQERSVEFEPLFRKYGERYDLDWLATTAGEGPIALRDAAERWG